MYFYPGKFKITVVLAKFLLPSRFYRVLFSVGHFVETPGRDRRDNRKEETERQM